MSGVSASNGRSHMAGWSGNKTAPAGNRGLTSRTELAARRLS